MRVPGRSKNIEVVYIVTTQTKAKENPEHFSRGLGRSHARGEVNTHSIIGTKSTRPGHHGLDKGRTYRQTHPQAHIIIEGLDISGHIGDAISYEQLSRVIPRNTNGIIIPKAMEEVRVILRPPNCGTAQ